MTLCILIGFTIRQNNYINATFEDLKNGGLHFPGDPNNPSVVLMGDSHASMYGLLLKSICLELNESLTVISVAGDDALPLQKHGSDDLWSQSLRIISNKKPSYLVIASNWIDKLQTDPERLSIAIQALKPYADHIILLNQPPYLPNEASRLALRNGSRPPFFEPIETHSKRESINDLLRIYISTNISVIDVSKYFQTTNGEVLFEDEEGKLLYQDVGHLSGYGTEKLHNILKYELSTQSIHTIESNKPNISIKP